MDFLSHAAKRTIDSGHDEVSEPLAEVRRLRGNARCFRCIEIDKDCYLERKRAGNFHCSTCKSALECQFRRQVIRESAASNFAWEELVADAVTVAGVTLPEDRPRKRPFSTVDDETPPRYNVQPPQLLRPPREIPSLISEPTGGYESLIHWGFPDDLRNTGAWFQTEPILQAAVDNVGFTPYTPGSIQFEDRQGSVIHGLYDASTNFDGQGSKISYEQMDMADVVGTQGSNTPSYSQLNSSALAFLPMPDISTPPKLTTVLETDIQNVSLPFKCPKCDETLHTRSELKKHTARHTKPYACTHPNCPRNTDGFATRNDLDRHIASVHDTNHAATMYRCAVPDCKTPTKVWARKDNFKAHLIRMHPESDTQDFLEKSTIDPPPVDRS